MIALDVVIETMDPKRWSWCCYGPSYRFGCCGHSSCSGGGCEYCDDGTLIRQAVDAVYQQWLFDEEELFV